jgi:hypothetical protein
MEMLKETQTYTTTLNPADALMATFTLTKIPVDSDKFPTTYHGPALRGTYFPYCFLVIENVDLGVNLTVEVNGDTLDGDFATIDDNVRYLLTQIDTATGATSIVVATTTTEVVWPEQDHAATSEFHTEAIMPKLRVYGSATVAAGKTVNITCYMAG